MKLIVDSGSTKTTWCLMADGQMRDQLHTGGMNPFFQSEEEMARIVASEVAPFVGERSLESVYFYGAGCGAGVFCIRWSPTF